MRRIWEISKRVYDAYVLFLVCLGMIVWTPGSYQSGRLLSFDDLMLTATKWLESWQ